MIDQCSDDPTPGHQASGLWTRQQTAKALRINVRTLDVWRRKLGLPFAKIGNKIYLDPRAVDKFVSNRANGAQQAPGLLNGNGHSGQNGTNGKSNGHGIAGSNGKLDGNVLDSGSRPGSDS